MAGAAAGTLPPVTSIHYRITTLSTPGGQFFNCFMNDHGVASATFFDAAGNSHGFVWRDSHGMVVDAPGAVSTSLNFVNNHGIASGTGAGGGVVAV